MSRCRRRWLALATAVFLGGCKVSPHGEWTPEACSDKQDNDLDGKIDCADPDCWAFACSVSPDASIGPLTPIVPRAGAAAMPDRNPPMSPPMKPDEEDASVGAGEDAGPAGCTDSWTCTPGEMCIDGRCQPIDISGEYALDLVSASVPIRAQSGSCFDPCLASDCIGCEPDPLVTIIKNSIEEVGATKERMDTVAPTWSDASFRLSLKNGDRLEFVVWDYEMLTMMTRIFSCSPDLLLQLPTGTLSCSPPSNSTVDPENGARFEIVAKVRKLR